MVMISSSVQWTRHYDNKQPTSWRILHLLLMRVCFLLLLHLCAILLQFNFHPSMKVILYFDRYSKISFQFSISLSSSILYQILLSRPWITIELSSFSRC